MRAVTKHRLHQGFPGTLSAVIKGHDLGVTRFLEQVGHEGALAYLPCTTHHHNERISERG
ncbi:MAG: hypothetical protein DCC49_02770 [Acidobacteria bacterium]|nr:MAG: hypothetical protein DCC49_02770 [Acidobacteriota bacterium]